MSDTQDTTEETSDESEGIRNLRARAEQADAAERKAAQAERELAFVKAGVDTSSKPAQALLNSYEGELEKDAILAEAKEWGLVSDTPPEKFTSDTPERQFQDQRDGVEQGRVADPNEAPKVSGMDAALNGFQKNREAGMTEADARAHAFGEVIKAAAAGDKSAIFDPVEWNKKATAAGHGAEFA